MLLLNSNDFDNERVFMDDTIIEKVLFNKTFMSIILLILMVEILILVCWGLRKIRHYKKLVALSIVLFIAITSYLGYDYAQICLDLKYKDYVTYQGEFIERSGGHWLSSIAIFDNSGREIKLQSSVETHEETSQWYGDTHYTGTVIYGRRSKTVVSCDATFLSFQ